MLVFGGVDLLVLTVQTSVCTFDNFDVTACNSVTGLRGKTRIEIISSASSWKQDIAKFWQACDIHTEHGIGDRLIYSIWVESSPRVAKIQVKEVYPNRIFEPFLRGKQKGVGFKLLKMQHQLIPVWYEVHNPWVSIPKKHWRVLCVPTSPRLEMFASPGSQAMVREVLEEMTVRMDSELGWLWGCLRLWT